MTTFLLYYSSTFQAQRSELPKVGTVVEIETINDLDDLMLRLDGNDLILRSPTEEHAGPHWLDYLDILDDHDHEQNYMVDNLPEGYQNMRWLEVYNSYRE